MITTTVRSLRPLGRLNLRGATVSAVRFNSSLPAGASKDNEHPHLYYHLQPPPPAAPRLIALSFLPQSPATADSKTVIGYLPAVQGVGLNNFSENKEFLKLLHQGIKGAIENGEAQSVEYLAHTRPGDGYLTLTDERNIPPMGRVGEPEDMLASIFVENGKPVASTYEPLPSYRLVTQHGVLQLPEDVDKSVLKVLEKVDAEERSASTSSSDGQGTQNAERERLEHLGSLLGGSGSDAAFDDFLAEAQAMEAEERAQQKKKQQAD